uniref:Uncharacterized protein n=1 Tax=Romanomermis culicivorax TaxID=13658 RepID=A0A915I8F1_ROMCU
MPFSKSSSSNYDLENYSKNQKINTNNNSIIGTKLNFIDSDSASNDRDDEEIQNSKSTSKIKFWFSWRMFIILIVFWGVNLYNVMRTMIGVTMICMVNSTARAFAILPADAVDFENFSNIQNFSRISIISSNFSRLEIPNDDEPICRPSDEVRDEYTHGDYSWTIGQQTNIIAALNWAQLFITFPAGLMGKLGVFRA